MGKRIAQVLAGLVGGICISQDVPWKAQKGQPAARFPAYDSQLPSGWPRDPHDLNDGVTGDVQRALNATKKAEHRLGRLMQDREKATLQWQEYAKASKAAYYKEKERYMKALQNYDRDIHEAQAAQNEARRALRDQVAGVYKSEQGLVMWSAIWCMLGSLFDTKARELLKNKAVLEDDDTDHEGDKTSEVEE
eukprot:s3502_g1.t1